MPTLADYITQTLAPGTARSTSPTGPYKLLDYLIPAGGGKGPLAGGPFTAGAFVPGAQGTQGTISAASGAPPWWQSLLQRLAQFSNVVTNDFAIKAWNAVDADPAAKATIRGTGTTQISEETPDAQLPLPSWARAKADDPVTIAPRASMLTVDSNGKVTGGPGFPVYKAIASVSGAGGSNDLYSLILAMGGGGDPFLGYVLGAQTVPDSILGVAKNYFTGRGGNIEAFDSWWADMGNRSRFFRWLKELVDIPNRQQVQSRYGVSQPYGNQVNPAYDALSGLFGLGGLNTGLGGGWGGVGG